MCLQAVRRLHRISLRRAVRACKYRSQFYGHRLQIRVASSHIDVRENFVPILYRDLVFEAFDDFAQALRLINESPYGLQAGIFTRDAGRIFQAFEELEVGGVIAGDVPSFRIDHMPYGGVKDSGLGREGLRYAIEDMTEPRLLVMNVR